VDGLEVRPSWELQPSQVVEARYTEDRAQQIEPHDVPLDVIYEDRWLLAINKARGMTAHPGDYDERVTVVHAVLARGHSLSDLSGESRPGIVHRLDKNTSGIMLIAKDNTTHRRLQESFKARQVEKVYLALVNGVPHPPEGRVELPIGRHPVARYKMAVVLDGRYAVTHYRVVADDGRFALVYLRPRTGRTHQLRVHMAHLGHAIVGDVLYGGVRRALQTADQRNDRELREMIEALEGGQALHAERLRFQHPRTGKPMDLRAEPPPVMIQLITKLGFSCDSPES